MRRVVFKVLQLACASTVFLAGSEIYAQKLTVLLINGDNGRPVGDKNVTIHYVGDPLIKEQVVHVGKDGRGSFIANTHMSEFTISEGPKIGKEPGRVAFLVCNRGANSFIKVEQVLSRGFAFENDCGKYRVSAQSGEIVFWARHIRWWMIDFQ